MAGLVLGLGGFVSGFLPMGLSIQGRMRSFRPLSTHRSIGPASGSTPPILLLSLAHFPPPPPLRRSIPCPLAFPPRTVRFGPIGPVPEDPVAAPARPLKRTRRALVRHFDPIARSEARVLRLDRTPGRSGKAVVMQNAKVNGRGGWRWRKVAVRAGIGAAGIACAAAMAPAKVAGGGRGGGFRGKLGGDGGGGGANGPQWLLAKAEEEDEFEETAEEEQQRKAEEEEERRRRIDTSGEFYVTNVKSKDLPVGPGVPTEDELFETLECQPGTMCSREIVQRDMDALIQSGLFDDVNVKVGPDTETEEPNACTLEYSFQEKIWPQVEGFSIEGSTLLPNQEISDEIMDTRPEGPCTVRTLAFCKNIIEKWYQDRGYVFGTVISFDGMESGMVTAHCVEGRIEKVELVKVDDSGNPKNEPLEVNQDVIMRELPFRIGELYNIEDGRKALRDIFQLQLFDNVQVVPQPEGRDPNAVSVEIMLKERPMKTAELELEWGIAPNAKGKPAIASLRPGGQVFFEHRNLAGEGRVVSASLSTGDLLSPQDDLGFKAEYVHPYFWSPTDPNKAALNVLAFNSRKLSPTFTSGSPREQVPPVFVDRQGVKVGISETYSRNSKGYFGVVAQDVTTKDEAGQVCTNGLRATPTGQYSASGPSTTISGKGRDRLLYLQGSTVRDTTYFLNGCPVGARDIFTIEQGILGGFFNRHHMSSTRFISLLKPKEGSSLPPVVAVLHGRLSNTIGDLAPYECFALGGPYSVRGYSVGELGAARRTGEFAAELRLPIPRFNTQCYGFFEHGTDFGSSKTVKGNPTDFYRRAGSGSSCGVGVRTGSVRFEFIRDMNAGKGHLFATFGERF